MKTQLQLWRVFYQSVVASALSAEVCWESNIGSGDRTNKLMMKTSSIIGCKWTHLRWQRGGLSSNNMDNTDWFLHHQM